MTGFLLRTVFVVTVGWCGWIYGVPAALGYLTAQQVATQSQFRIDGYRYRSVADPCSREEIEVAVPDGDHEHWVPLRRGW